MSCSGQDSMSQENKKIIQEAIASIELKSRKAQEITLGTTIHTVYFEAHKQAKNGHVERVEGRERAVVAVHNQFGYRTVKQVYATLLHEVWQAERFNSKKIRFGDRVALQGDERASCAISLRYDQGYLPEIIKNAYINMHNKRRGIQAYMPQYDLRDKAVEEILEDLLPKSKRKAYLEKGGLASPLAEIAIISSELARAGGGAQSDAVEIFFNEFPEATGLRDVYIKQYFPDDFEELVFGRD